MGLAAGFAGHDLVDDGTSGNVGGGRLGVDLHCVGVAGLLLGFGNLHGLGFFVLGFWRGRGKIDARGIGCVVAGDEKVKDVDLRWRSGCFYNFNRRGRRFDRHRRWRLRWRRNRGFCGRFGRMIRVIF